jgi:hypothetical protein
LTFEYLVNIFIGLFQTWRAYLEMRSRRGLHVNVKQPQNKIFREQENSMPSYNRYQSSDSGRDEKSRILSG